MIAPLLSAEALARLTAGTMDAVVSAASVVPGVDAPVRQGRAVHDSSPAAFLLVSPSSVGLQATRAHLADQAAERRWARAQRAIDDAVDATMRPMAMVVGNPFRSRASKPRQGLAWTRASIFRMRATIADLDLAPLFECGRAPLFLTFTLPDRWEQLAPTPRAFRDFLHKFKIYFVRSFGYSPVGIWKLEFQRRGAPHLHLLMSPPEGVAQSGRYKGLDFSSWVRHVWADVVGEPDPLERAKHLVHGVDIRLYDVEGRDARAVVDYFTKHGLFRDKGYQNELPQLWADAIAAGEPSAHFWGVWRLQRALVARRLDVRAAARLDDAGSAELAAVLDPLAVARLVRLVAGIMSEPDDRYFLLRTAAQLRRAGLDEWAARCSEALMRTPDSPWMDETDRSWLRSHQRLVDDAGSSSSDAVRVARHLRKLDRARWHRQHRDRLVRNRYGQLVLPGAVRDDDGLVLVDEDGRTRRHIGAPRVLRRVRVEHVVDPSTAELVPRRRLVKCGYRVGWFNGTTGRVMGLDGVAAARDVARLLLRRSDFTLGA